MLLVGFALVQSLGLGIHTINEIQLARIEQQREIATHDVIIYRHIAAAPVDERAALLATEAVPNGDRISLDTAPPSPDNTFALPLAARQIIRASIFTYGIPEYLRPHGLEIRGATAPLRYVISFALPGGDLPPPARMLPPDSEQPGEELPPPPPPLPIPRPHGGLFPPGQVWLTISSPITAPEPWRSPEFGEAFIVMTALGAIMIFWAVRQMMIPVRTLADAAERLGPRRRERAGFAGDRADGNRDRGDRVQHDGLADPPLCRGPDVSDHRHRPRSAHADHPAETSRRIYGRRRTAGKNARRP